MGFVHRKDQFGGNESFMEMRGRREKGIFAEKKRKRKKKTTFAVCDGATLREEGDKSPFLASEGGGGGKHFLYRATTTYRYGTYCTTISS